MGTEIVKTNTGEIIAGDSFPSWTRDQIDLIKRTVAIDATDDELKLFLYQAKRANLDPLSRQIHFVKRGGKGVIQTAIDGYRSIADRTGLYAGNDDYRYDEGISEYEHITMERGNPITATATVYKIVGGQRVPFSATVRWEEYFPGEKQGFMWKKMPYFMLGKCAEALALRKAFPQELGGLYTHEEMQQAGGRMLNENWRDTDRTADTMAGLMNGGKNAPKKLNVNKLADDVIDEINEATDRITKSNKTSDAVYTCSAKEILADGEPFPPEIEEAKNAEQGTLMDEPSPEGIFRVEVSGKTAFENKDALTQAGYRWKKNTAKPNGKALVKDGLIQEEMDKELSWLESFKPQPFINAFDDMDNVHFSNSK